MQPKNEEDLVFKLTSTKFNSAKDLLSFYESNRELYSTASHEPYQLTFKRLLVYQLSEAKKGKNEEALFTDPTFKSLLSDYNKHLGSSDARGEKLFSEFFPAFESLMGLHRGRRFKVNLPDKVRVTYLCMMNDEAFLKEHLTLKQLAYLLYANASPGLLQISIKVSCL
jgi:hypothetical protein